MTQKLSYTVPELDVDIGEGYDNVPKTNWVYDDFAFSIINLRINPISSKPDFDFTNGEFTFDDSTTETVIGSQISSHTFVTGPAVTWYPHIHWVQESVGTVVWQLEYKMWKANELEPGWTTITTTQQEFPYTSGSLHQISVLPNQVVDVDSTATLVKVRISRLGGDVNDTYTGDARFMGFDFHVPIDQLGSRQEFIK